MTGRQETSRESRPQPEGTGEDADRVTQLAPAAIAEEVYRSMLPANDRAFCAELKLWPPELKPERYLARRRYPRCWVFTAALIFAFGHAEYARALLESLRLGPTVRLTDHDDDMALRVADGALSQLEAESWRVAVCRTGADLWLFGPQSMNRAFALGLNLAFVGPEAARDIVGVVRSADLKAFAHQMEAARHVIRGHPLSRVAMPPPWTECLHHDLPKPRLRASGGEREIDSAKSGRHIQRERRFSLFANRLLVAAEHRVTLLAQSFRESNFNLFRFACVRYGP